MIDRRGKTVDYLTFESEVFNFLTKNLDTIDLWVALLEAQLIHPHNRFINESRKPKKTYPPKELGEYFVSYEWNSISTRQIEMLCIISEFDSTGLIRSLIESCHDNWEQKHGKYNDRSFAVAKFRSLSNPSYLYLLYMTIHSKDSFFGRLSAMIKRIQFEVRNSGNYSNYQSIFRPFWRKLPRNRVQKYTGWARHQKDHGSLSPDNFRVNNHRDDFNYQLEERKRIDKLDNSFNDHLSFIQGWIE